MRPIIIASTLLLACTLAGCSDDGDSPTTTVEAVNQPSGQGLPTCDDLDLPGIQAALTSDALSADGAATSTQTVCTAGEVTVELTDNASASSAAAMLEGASGIVVDGLADQAKLDEANGQLLVQSSSLTVRIVAPGTDGDALVTAFELVAQSL